jgi:OTU domain-containing protein 5
VLDGVGKWAEAQVIEVDDAAGRVLISYLFWSDNFNEWIDYGSSRLAPPGTQTYAEGGVLAVGQRVEARDTVGSWLEAVVSEAHPSHVRVHFLNWHTKFDEDMPRGSSRIRPYGRAKQLSKRSVAKRATSVQSQRLADRTRHLKPSGQRFDRYSAALGAQDLTVAAQEGDGNCLFRSVAHQVYGDSELHLLVRSKCCAYMRCVLECFFLGGGGTFAESVTPPSIRTFPVGFREEKEYFEPFVEGEMADFLAYVDHKSGPGVWGDDPEIQVSRLVVSAS